MPPEARLRIGWVWRLRRSLVRASRIRAVVVCGRRPFAFDSPGSLKRAIWLRPSSLARYIAWSAATSTASGPPACSLPNIVMPTLIVTGSDSGAGRALSATWARRSSPSCSAPSVSVCGISTASSSPERRATMSVVRTRSRRILAIWRIRLSPAWWPRLSLTALRPSMSMIITAPWPP